MSTGYEERVEMDCYYVRNLSFTIRTNIFLLFFLLIYIFLISPITSILFRIGITSNHSFCAKNVKCM